MIFWDWFSEINFLEKIFMIIWELNFCMIILLILIKSSNSSFLSIFFGIRREEGKKRLIGFLRLWRGRKDWRYLGLSRRFRSLLITLFDILIICWRNSNFYLGINLRIFVVFRVKLFIVDLIIIVTITLTTLPTTTTLTITTTLTTTLTTTTLTTTTLTTTTLTTLLYLIYQY